MMLFKRQKNKVQDEMNALTNEKKSHIENELKKITDAKELWTKELTDKNPAVVFSARNVKDREFTDGLVMVFRDVNFNKGDAYNKENGIFTVPRTDVYMLTVQFCVYGDKWFRFEMVAKGRSFYKSRIHDKTNFSCYSYSAVTFVNKNDDVKVRITGSHSGTILHEDLNYYWNTFSGALIQAL